MSNGFPLVPLGEILEQDTQYVDSLEPRLYPKLSVRLYGRGVVLDSPADGASVLMKRHQMAKAGQVILSEIWGKKGAIGIVPAEGAGALVTSHFFLFEVRPNRAERQYIEWILRGNLVQSQLENEARGTTGYAAVRPKQLFQAKIPLPPIPEQRRIVARIEELAAKIEEARGLRRQGMSESDAIVTRATEATVNRPEWPGQPLRELLSEDSQNGLSAHPSDAPPGLPILRISAGTSRADAIVDEGDHKYLDVGERDAARYLLRPGDLLACRFNGNLRYVGKFSLFTGYSDAPRLYPDKLIRFRVDRSKVLPEFLRIAMNSQTVRRVVEGFCATTAGNIGISAGRLKGVPVRTPSIQEQRRIVAYLDDLQARVDTLKRLQAETAAELEAMLPAVLDRAFRGEL